MKFNKGSVYCFFLVIAVIMFIIDFSVFPFSKLMFFIDFCITSVIIIVIGILLKNYIKYLLDTSKFVNLFLNESGKKIFNSIPVGVVFTLPDSSGEILSYNDVFKDKFLNGEDLILGSIKEFLPTSYDKNLLNEKGLQITHSGRKFLVYLKKIEEYDIFYFVDNTNYKKLKRKYLERQICVALAVFDNKEEIYQSVGEDKGLRLLVDVENILSKWVSDCMGIFKKLSDGKYIILFEEKYLRYFISEKFEIINKIHEIKVDSHKFATISIGISRGYGSLEESKNLAENALNMALGRGGDQVALKSTNGYEFFGGASQGLEKRSKVRSRVVAMALMEKMQLCDAVFIMGHKMSDFDSFGSAVGLWSIASKIGNKTAYIVLNFESSMADQLVGVMKKYGCSNFIISPQDAMSKMTSNSFLIVVDTHSEKFLESYSLYRMFSHTAIIDHHRMTVDKIDSSDIFFHEPSASSTCEMVTELIQYMDDKHLKKWEAECLLAGIMLDTKSFSVKSGVRTFEAGAYLKKKGAESSEVKKMFADSIDVYKVKCRIIEKAYILNGCAISKCEENLKNFRISCVQAADELLDIKDIRASFVIFKSENAVNISARSLGEVNVQLIMESLGGGGHHNMAAACIPDIDLDSAEEKLKKIIEINL